MLKGSVMSGVTGQQVHLFSLQGVHFGRNILVRTLTEWMKIDLNVIGTIVGSIAASTPKMVSNCLVPQTVALNHRRTLLLTG